MHPDDSHLDPLDAPLSFGGFGGQRGSPSVVGPTYKGSGGKLTPEALRRVDKWGGCLATSPQRWGLSEIQVNSVPDMGAARLQGKEPGHPGPRGQLPKLNRDPGVGRRPPKGPTFPNSSLDLAGGEGCPQPPSLCKTSPPPSLTPASCFEAAT